VCAETSSVVNDGFVVVEVVLKTSGLKSNVSSDISLHHTHLPFLFFSSSS